MKPNRQHIEKQRAEVVNTRTRSFQSAKKAADWTAVCLVGTSRAIPREFGDNRGAWPVRIMTSKDPKKVVAGIDREQPMHGMALLDHVWVETPAHADRLKAALDELLVGRHDDAQLRFSWRDIEAAPHEVWPTLLTQALVDIELAGEEIEVIGAAEKNRRIAALARGPKWAR